MEIFAIILDTSTPMGASSSEGDFSKCSSKTQYLQREVASFVSLKSVTSNYLVGL